MKRIFLLILAMLVANAATAEQWTENLQATDYVTSEKVRAAEGLDSKSNKVSIYRTRDNRVRLAVRLSDSSFEQLAKSGKILAIRGDDLKAWFFEYNPNSSAQDAYVYDKTFRTILWHGNGRAPYSGTLRDIMDSSSVYIRIFLDGGSHTDTKLDMKGAREIISQAINVPPTVTAAERNNSIRSRELSIQASNKCFQNPSYRDCNDKISVCNQKDEGSFDEFAYKSCVKNKGLAID